MDLGERARAVLEANRRGAWTCPSATLYPHQWLWDSCFIAMGLARVEPPRAADELRAVFRGQWANGMLPHMIFAVGVKDVGNRRVWQSRRNPLAPRDVETSCITQPPLVAVAAPTRRSDAAAGRRAGVPGRTVAKADRVPLVVVHRAGSEAARASSPSSIRGRAGWTRVHRGCARSNECRCRGGCGSRRRSGSRGSSVAFATTLATCLRWSDRPTTTGSACLRSSSWPRSTDSSSIACLRSDRC